MYLREVEKLEADVSKKNYKLKFSLTSKQQDTFELITKICVRILKVNDSNFCVEFSKISGDELEFLSHFNKIKSTVLMSFANDTVVQ